MSYSLRNREPRSWGTGHYSNSRNSKAPYEIGPEDIDCQILVSVMFKYILYYLSHTMSYKLKSSNLAHLSAKIWALIIVFSF